MTPLHWCAYNNNAEGVRLLLKMVCVHLSLPSLYCLLLPQGADVAVTDVEGKAALHWTANNTDDRTARTILVSRIPHCTIGLFHLSFLQELAPTAINLKDGEERTGTYALF